LFLAIANGATAAASGTLDFGMIRVHVLL
jgi:hypothetical protein